jgi:prophage DNA circulation protein
MQKSDAIEAADIIQRVAQQLLLCIPQAGELGSQARTALGDLIANALTMLAENTVGVPLTDCFDLVREAGATSAQFEGIRRDTALQTPVTIGGVIVQNSCIQLCLAAEAEIIAAMTFVSRQDVEAMVLSIRQPFADAIELAADEMDQMTFQDLISLQAAVTNHLVTTGRPLPRLVNYQFAKVLPSLVIAYRLYADASRADEIRNENKIVHPAFCPPLGLALGS